MDTDSNDSKKIELKKNLNVISCVSYLISMIVGAGIFVVPNSILRESGSVGAAFLIWIFGGVFSIFGALSYAELGCLIPKTGGEYIYLKTAFSDIFGFLFVWSYTFIYNPAVAAFAALLFSDYALKPFFPNCDPPVFSRITLAISVTMVMTVVNAFSVKLGQYLGYVFNLGKIAGLALIMIIGVYGIWLGKVESFKDPFENSSTSIGRIANAFNIGCFAYGSWNTLNNLVGEMKNPNKTLPISIFTGLAMVVFIYLSVNVAYLTFLTPKEMIDSNAVAFTFVEKLIGPQSWIMTIFVCLSGLGFINGSLVASSRQIFAAANNDHMPSIFSLISIQRRTPITSVFLAGLLAIIYILIEDMNTLLNISMLLVYIFNQLCTLSLLYMRKTKPNDERPFKVNLFFPIVFLVACFFLAIMICYTYAYESFLCLIFVSSGLPVYYVCTKCEKPNSVQINLNAVNVWAQKLMIAVTESNEEKRKN